MSLSEQDRETLLNALWDDGCHGFGSDHTHWPIAVEAIVARHVRAALTEAERRVKRAGHCDEPLNAEGRRVYGTAYFEDAARIVRNLAAAQNSPLTSP